MNITSRTKVFLMIAAVVTLFWVQGASAGLVDPTWIPITQKPTAVGIPPRFQKLTEDDAHSLLSYEHRLLQRSYWKADTGKFSALDVTGFRGEPNPFFCLTVSNHMENDIYVYHFLQHCNTARVKKDFFSSVENSLIKRAEEGCPTAQYTLGRLYEDGYCDSYDRDQKSDEKAMEWYEKAAQNGHGDAQFLLGQLYAGRGVIQDDEQAAKWISMAAEQGHVEAQFSLAKVYEQGKGIPQNLEKAAYWFYSAAEQDHLEARLCLANAFKLGRGVPQSYENAAKCYQIAANQGHIEAEYLLGKAFELGQGVPQSYEEAVKCYKGGARKDHNEATYALGMAYELGQGVPQNAEQAMEEFRHAANKGHADSLYKMGLYYSFPGRSVEFAIKYMAFAANKGHKEARLYIESIFSQHGDVVQEMAWKRTVAEQGDPGYQFELGQAFLVGKGVTIDPKAAIEWFKKAAEQGHPGAIFSLGTGYWTGFCLTQDLDEGMKCFRSSAKLGHQPAKERLAFLFKPQENAPTEKGSFKEMIQEVEVTMDKLLTRHKAIRQVLGSQVHNIDIDSIANSLLAQGYEKVLEAEEEVSEFFKILKEAKPGFMVTCVHPWWGLSNEQSVSKANLPLMEFDDGYLTWGRDNMLLRGKLKSIGDKFDIARGHMTMLKGLLENPDVIPASLGIVKAKEINELEKDCAELVNIRNGINNLVTRGVGRRNWEFQQEFPF